MEIHRRQLEEIIFSTLLNQLSSSQIEFLNKIGKGIYLCSNDQKYYDTHVQEIIKQNFINIKKTFDIPTELFNEFRNAMFKSEELIEIFYKKMNDSPEKITNDDFNDYIVFYYAQKILTPYEEKFINFLYKSIENAPNKRRRIKDFYNEIYIMTSHPRRVQLMQYLIKSENNELMDSICEISEEYGTPGYFFEIRNHRDFSIDVIICKNEESHQKTFLSNETVYSIASFAVVYFNINFHYYYLRCNINDKVIDITSKDYARCLCEIVTFPENTNCTIQMNLLPKDTEVSYNQLYYTDDTCTIVKSSIDDILRIWAILPFQVKYLSQEDMFYHLQNDERFKKHHSFIFKEFYKISYDELLEKVKEMNPEFCLFNLIIGFTDDDKPYLLNTSLYEMPRTLLTDPDAHWNKKVINFKRPYLLEKDVAPLIDHYMFYHSRPEVYNQDNLNLFSKLYKTFKKAKSQEEKELFRFFTKYTDVFPWDVMKQCLTIYLIFLVNLQKNMSLFNDQKNNRNTIWEVYYTINNSKPVLELIQEEIELLSSQITDSVLKGSFISNISQSMMTEQWYFVYKLLSQVLNKECTFDEKAMRHFDYFILSFDTNNSISFPIIMFFFGYYFPKKNMIEDLENQINKIADPMSKFSIIYYLYKAQKNQYELQTNSSCFTYSTFTISYDDCYNDLIKERQLHVIWNDLRKMFPSCNSRFNPMTKRINELTPSQ